MNSVANLKTIKAIAFDVDGTLTHRGRFTIPEHLLKTLTSIPKQVPLALCTGRPLDYLGDVIDTICDASDNPKAERKRWHLLCENGAAGFYYNEAKDQYESFFENPWPSEVIMQSVLKDKLKKAFPWVKTIIRDHTFVIVFGRWGYRVPRILKWVSARSQKKIIQLFKELGLNEHFVVKDSSLANLILPKGTNKGDAVQRWSRYLGLSSEEILCVGDKPGPGGNDEELLDGKCGLPFTVGEETKEKYPFAVLDEKGKKLHGPDGTDFLLKKVFPAVQ